ncbi:HNH endonuclease signature motif containing protein [Endozoicomonas sp. GU-1]|uniref:HNH endonuclease n=1 Tax=Endozoicomonas sp. GU-1 TaxID=3009078 RepID=UPI0022B490B5|nr:HNH endonuclease signature motif containing protein [Endozoicomonas sp. GU-1]WBA80112.1 HNH endonuclease signature motif containing protein [Endozoicomonas sp. GU-1]
MTTIWTEEELEAAVLAYMDMHRKDTQNEHYIKKNYYSDLSKRFDRTEKAFEYRMQNISYVMSLMGRKWVKGLKPAKNVGSNHIELIERLISKAESKSYVGQATFESQVSELKKKKTLSKPLGEFKPQIVTTQVTQYQRDPKVKAWVLKEANGYCECCDSEAPFLNADGEPFLEVHHLRHLADGGSDRVTNAIALCPNCHREFHYGQSITTKLVALYAKHSRLIRE